VKRVLVFANPIAGRGLGEAIARRVGEGLSAGGYDAHVCLRPPSELTVEDVPPDVVAAVAIGGDGTVRAVAERLYELARHPATVVSTRRGATLSENHPQPPGHEPPPMLLVPLGTANLMGRHLGLEWDDARLEEQVLEAVRGGTVTHVDTARANGKLFLLMAGVGFDAAVVHELSRVRRGPISYFSYLEPAARIAGSYAFPPIKVMVDGHLVFGPEPGVAFIGNIAEYGTGFPMLPHATPDDGLLDICCIPCANLLQATHMFLLAAAGEHLQEEGVVYLKGKHVRVESPKSPRGVPVQIDGDAGGYTPLEVEMLPGRLGLIVPP
jgi:diacylglycerol kinase (ATP)